MSNIEISIRDKDTQAGKPKDQLKKEIKKIDRFIKKAEAKIRAYEKQIEQMNSVSEDTKKQVALGLSLLQKEADKELS